MANDMSPNFLFRNRGDGAFSDYGMRSGTALSTDGAPQAGMGVDAADFDRDGDLDIVVTNSQLENNTFYQNDGPFFSEVSFNSSARIEQMGSMDLRLHYMSSIETFTRLSATNDVNVIFGINDDSTTGGMAAYRAAGLDEDTLVAIGFGLEGTVGRAALLDGASYRAALGMFPEFVGTSLVDAAVKVASGQTLPTHCETPTLVITLDNFEQFYRPVGDDYDLRLDAVRALMPEAAR